MMRAPVAMALMLVATGTGIAAASAIVPAGSPGEEGPDALQPGPAELIVGARSEDPSRSASWGVRTYISKTGMLCVERGLVAGPVFGDRDEHGRVRERPAGPTGICGEPWNAVVAGVERVAAHDDEPAMTFVLGASLRHPQRAVVHPAGARPVELPLGARGSFIGAFEGIRDPEELPLTVFLADGSAAEIDWRGPRGRP